VRGRRIGSWWKVSLLISPFFAVLISPKIFFYSCFVKYKGGEFQIPNSRFQKKANLTPFDHAAGVTQNRQRRRDGKKRLRVNSPQGAQCGRLKATPQGETKSEFWFDKSYLISPAKPCGATREMVALR
jgi:hypothetical protein